MSRFPRLARVAAVGAFAVSAMTMFAASPAGAVATASMVDNGNGSITVTYSGNVAGPSGYDVFLTFMTQGSTCPAMPFTQYTYVLSANPVGGSSPNMAASPATVTSGTLVMGSSGPQGIALPAGLYQACLYTNIIQTSTFSSAGSLAVTIGNPVVTTSSTSTSTTMAPTTTTTAASGATTSTTAAGDPVAPAYTG